MGMGEHRASLDATQDLPAGCTLCACQTTSRPLACGSRPTARRRRLTELAGWLQDRRGV